MLANAARILAILIFAAFANIILSSCSGSSSTSPAANPPTTTTGSNGPNTFLYAAAWGLNSIQVYSVNTANVQPLTLLQSIPSGGSSPNALILHPSKKFIFALNYNTGTAVSFGIDQKTGLLTKLATSTAYTYAGTFSYDGKYFYSTAFGTSIAGYSVDATTGALTALAGSPFVMTGASDLTDVAITHDNSLIFSADNIGGKIYAAKVAVNGTLTASGTSVTDATVDALAISPDNKFLFAGGYGSGHVASYQITDTSGNLSQVTSLASNTIGVLLLNSAGTQLFTGSSLGKTTYGYSVNASTGALQLNSVTLEGGMAKSMTLDSSEKLLAVASQYSTGVTASEDGLSLYTLDSTGTPGETQYIPYPPNSQLSAVKFVTLP